MARDGWTGVSIPDDMAKRLQGIVDSDGRYQSKSEIIRQVVGDWLDTYEGVES